MFIDEDHRYFQLSDLETYIGSENLCDYDLTAIIEEATYVDLDDPEWNRYWRNGIDLAEICARHDISDAADEKMVDVSEASEMLGVSRQRVHQLLKDGKLDGRIVGKTWYVYQGSVDDRLSGR